MSDENNNNENNHLNEIEIKAIDEMIEKLETGEVEWDDICDCCQDQIMDRKTDLIFEAAYDAAARLCCAKINAIINETDEDMIEELEDFTEDMIALAKVLEAENLKYEEKEEDTETKEEEIKDLN